MRRLPFLLSTLLLGSSTVFSQDRPLPEGLLVVETNTPTAVVMVGSEVIGVASESPFSLAVGPQEITLVEATSNGWSPRRVTGTAEIEANETSTLRLDLPIRYRIDSMPPGAEIVLESDGLRELLGVTPLTVDRPEPMTGMLVAQHPGFMRTEMAPGDSTFNHHRLMMPPLEAGAELDAASTWIPPHEPRRWIDYAAASLAAAAAGVAIYYKFEADAVDDRYRSPDSPERGNPILKDEAERLDLYSLAALGVMQVGITVLSVRFILR